MVVGRTAHIHPALYFKGLLALCAVFANVLAPAITGRYDDGGQAGVAQCAQPRGWYAEKPRQPIGDGLHRAHGFDRGWRKFSEQSRD